MIGFQPIGLIFFADPKGGDREGALERLKMPENMLLSEKTRKLGRESGKIRKM